MAGVIELETDVPFDPSEWIGTNRLYKNVPLHVADAFNAIRAIFLRSSYRGNGMLKTSSQLKIIEDEGDYEEPEEGSGSKKRRPKAPRGASKKQKKKDHTETSKANPTRRKKGGKK
ncbi:hypothetical protein R3P38DRAFT_2788862 [Favolaschia claudopus]|uniref:Uncharacterized protein n=1 Tax=Favolaschia claudopus TaxID=2862362 RepID=A0AAW0ALR0_9AGAR